MQLCSEGHDEVCYDGRYCPACNMREDLEGVIEEKDTMLHSMEQQIDELQDENMSLKAEISE